MKDPAFLFYSSDFLSGVADLTMDERGQYITLLCLQHQKGNLNEKTIMLNVGNVSLDVLKKFEKDEFGNYFNERLRIETEKRNKFTESRRNNGNLGGRPKEIKEPKENLKDNLMVMHKDNLMGNENKDKNIDIKETEIKEKHETFNFENSLIEYGFEKQLVTDWLIVRKNKRASNTQTAFNNFITEIEKTKKDKNELLKIIVGNSWQGFNSKWILGDKPTPPEFIETRLKK